MVTSIRKRTFLVGILSFCFPLFVISCLGEDFPDRELQDKIFSYGQTVTARATQVGKAFELAKTMQVEATETSRSKRSTQSANVTNYDASMKVTATAIAPIIAELPFYDVDPLKGDVGWIHPPATIALDGYREFDFINDYPMVVSRDFVLAGDITWNTQYGTSGCGFIFRADGDFDSGNQYVVILTRGANGHLLFLAYSDGKIGYVQDFYVNKIDPDFHWENETTNRLSVVARGMLISIYTNYNLIGEVDISEEPPFPNLPPKPQKPDGSQGDLALELYENALDEHSELVSRIQGRYQEAITTYREVDIEFEVGFVGLVALSESGYTECRFNDVWLWLISDK